MITPEYLNRLRDDLLVEAELRGRTFRFHTTWGVFSPREIDEGTELLLRHIEVEPTANCLDLGCGYGPIGMTLAALAPQGRTVMLDKDFVAVEYANANARRNGLGNCEARLSNGLSAVRGESFDLIASNLPAKVGKEMLYLYMVDALAALPEGGRFYVVTINGLRDFIKGAFKTFFGHYDKVKQGRTYTVAYGEKTAKALDLGGHTGRPRA